MLALLQVSVTDWKTVFLYNGDSLVLPLLSQSFANGEPFHWVFSTQTFFFPEYPLYWLCSAIAGSVRGGLLLNAVLNVILLYGLFRIIARTLGRGSNARQVVTSSIGVVIFMGSVLSERSANLHAPGIVDPASIATLFLLTTYYYGVILVALTVIALTIRLTRRYEDRGGAPAARMKVGYAVAATTLAAATTYSNPLYVVQFALPLVGSALAVLLTRRMRARWFVLVVGSQALGLVIGEGCRIVFARFIESDYGAYIGPTHAPQAILVLLGVVIEWVRSGTGGVEVVLLALTVTLVIAALRRLVRSRSKRLERSAQNISAAQMLLIVFPALSIASLLAGQVITGQTLTRYLVPLFIFPQLVALLFADERFAHSWLLYRRAKRILRFAARSAVVWVSSVAMIGLTTIAVTVGPVHQMTLEPYQPAACLDSWLDGSSANGVGDFMTTRPILLYGTQRGKVLQVMNGVAVQPWMNNLALYQGRRFSFVLLPDGSNPTSITNPVGTPTSITKCDGFSIYSFTGAAEENLNDWIEVSLAQVLKDRSF
jgi:hypothetical protein